jgi:hypothetical protein
MNYRHAVWLAFAFRVFIGGVVVLWGVRTSLPLSGAVVVGSAIIALPWLNAYMRAIPGSVPGWLRRGES